MRPSTAARTSAFPAPRARRGSALVEFTFLAPLLVSLFIGVISFGYSFQMYNRLEESVRSGARFASVNNYDAFSGIGHEHHHHHHHGPDPPLPICASCTFQVTGSSDFLRNVQNVTVYGTPTPSASQLPIVEGMTPSNVAVYLQVWRDVPVEVSVAVTNFRLPMLGTRLFLNNKPVTRFPFLGHYAPFEGER